MIELTKLEMEQVENTFSNSFKILFTLVLNTYSLVRSD